jgi:hypothetical protein
LFKNFISFNAKVDNNDIKESSMESSLIKGKKILKNADNSSSSFSEMKKSETEKDFLDKNEESECLVSLYEDDSRQTRPKRRGTSRSHSEINLLKRDVK